MKNTNGTKLIANNKKAFHDYFVLEKYEAGIVLFGSEIKSVRRGGMNLKDSYCMFHKGELFIEGMHISPYKEANIFNRDPYRDRKLLLNKKELVKLQTKQKLDGVAIVPLQAYLKSGLLKIEIGVCKGKELHDKREDLKRKSVEKEIRQFKY